MGPVHNHLAKILKYFKIKIFVTPQFSMRTQCIFVEKHAKPKISCPYGQLIYIIIFSGNCFLFYFFSLILSRLAFMKNALPIVNITEEIYIVIPEYLLSNIVVLSKLINIININDIYNPLIYFTYAPPLLFSFLFRLFFR